VAPDARHQQQAEPGLHETGADVEHADRLDGQARQADRARPRPAGEDGDVERDAERRRATGGRATDVGDRAPRLAGRREREGHAQQAGVHGREPGVHAAGQQ
jgi:hypothetical protein